MFGGSPTVSESLVPHAHAGTRTRETSDLRPPTNDHLPPNKDTSDKPPCSEPGGSGPSPAGHVFEAYLAGWRERVGRGVEPKLTDKRRGLVRARLKDHPVQVLVAAAGGIWRSTWHVENNHTEFDLAMRDAAHVERFAREASGGQTKTGAEGAVARPRGAYEVQNNGALAEIERRQREFQARSEAAEERGDVSEI